MAYWLMQSVLCFGINALIWWGNVDIKCKIWCDISTKLIFGGFMGLPCSSIVVLRQLEEIGATRKVRSTAQDKRNQLYFELGVGIVIPVIYMALHIVNQGHRFDIYEDIGCFPTYYLTPVAVVMVLLPPAIASCIGLVYSKAVWSFPVNIMIVVTKFTLQKAHINPWKGWDDTHYDFGHIYQVTAKDFDYDRATKQYWSAATDLGRYGPVVGCIFFFLFFGTGQEAQRLYSSIWARLTFAMRAAARFIKTPFAKERTSLPPSSPDTWNVEVVIAEVSHKSAALDNVDLDLGDLESCKSSQVQTPK
ncbi:a-factor receptor [Tilletia horrida]|nr:a-factor receptor [Tilletia horrida]